LPMNLPSGDFLPSRAALANDANSPAMSW
jgi:hypothetical protein